MSHTSHLHTLVHLFQKIEKDDISGVLEDILTPGEIDEIAGRIDILELLATGMSQRDVAEKLKISVTTVSRGNRVLQYDGRSIQKYLPSIEE